MGSGLHPGVVGVRLAVDQRLGAVQGEGGHGGVAVGGPEGRGAVADGRPAVAQHRRAAEAQGPGAVGELVAAVGVGRGDADGVGVHAQGRAVDGRQQPRGARPLFAGVHFLQLEQGQRGWVQHRRGGHGGGEGRGEESGGGGGGATGRLYGEGEDEGAAWFSRACSGAGPAAQGEKLGHNEERQTCICPRC